MKFEDLILNLEVESEQSAFEWELLEDDKADKMTPFCKTVKLLEVESVMKNGSCIRYEEANGKTEVVYVNRGSELLEPYKNKTICISGAENKAEHRWDILSFFDVTEFENGGMDVFLKIGHEEQKKYMKNWKNLPSAMKKDLSKKLSAYASVGNNRAIEDPPVIYRTLEELDILYEVVKRVLPASHRAEYESCRNSLSNRKNLSNAEKNNLHRVMTNILEGVPETAVEDTIDVTRVMSEIRTEFWGQESALNQLEMELIGMNLSKKAPQTLNFVGNRATALAHSLAKALKRPISVINLCGQKGTTEKYIGSGRIYENGQEGIFYKYLQSVGPKGIILIEQIDQYDDKSMLKLVEPLILKQTFVDSFMLVPMELKDNIIITSCDSAESLPRSIRSAVKEIILKPLSDETKRAVINEWMIPKFCKEYHVKHTKKECVSKEAADILIHQLGRNDMGRLEASVRDVVIRAASLGMNSFPVIKTKEDLEKLISFTKDDSLKSRFVTEIEALETKFFENYNDYPELQRNRILALFDKVHNSPGEKDHAYPLSVLRTLVNLRYEAPKPYIAGGILKEFSKTHYGLTEYAQALEDAILANQHRLKPDKITTILLHGKPGTGKTSTARAVANALGRKLITISMPGKDATAFKGLASTHSNAKMNCLAETAAKESLSFGQCLFLFDEIDKMENSSQKNGYDALHELLDPNQDCFFDEYADCFIRKDNAMFICTANDISKLPDSLRDRMIVVEMRPYSVSEKGEIATYILSKYAKEFGMEGISFAGDALQYLLKNYSVNFGVRDLEKDIEKLLVRKLGKCETSVEISVDDIQEILGASRSKSLIDMPMAKDKNPLPGQANALGVIGSAGSIFAIQVMQNEFQKEELVITGLAEGSCLETCKVAVSLASALLKQKLPKLHIHFTDSGIKKDGPSAGITTFLAVISCMLKQPIPQNVAFTGTIDPLYHTIGSIGGVREKLGAAEMAGMKTVFIPQENYEELRLKNELKDFSSLEIIPVAYLADIVRTVFGYEFM